MRVLFQDCRLSNYHYFLFMLFVKENSSLDNRVGRFAVSVFLAVLIYFLIGIFSDFSRIFQSL